MGFTEQILKLNQSNMESQRIFEFYKKYRIIIFPVVSSIAGLVLIATIIVPQLLKLVENNSSYIQITEKNSFLETKAQELSSIDSTDLQRKVNISFLALPAYKDLAEVIGLLQKTISQSGFSLVSLQFGKDTTISGQQAFRVIATVQGASTAFSSLMESVEHSYRPMKINSIEITNPRNSQEIVGTLNIDVFYTSIPNALGSVEAPLPKLDAKDEEVIANLSRVAPRSEINITDFATTSPRGKENPFE